MNIKARLPEFLFIRRKKKYDPLESIQIEIEVTDAFGRKIVYASCWRWKHEIRHGLHLSTGVTEYDNHGARAQVSIKPGQLLKGK